MIQPRWPVAVAALFSLMVLHARAQTELILDGSFESVNLDWTMTGGALYGTSASVAHTGTNFLWLGGAANQQDAAYQTITIPATATNAVLSFYYNIYSSEGTAAVYDTFSAAIQNNSGTTLATVGTWSNVNKDPAPGNPYYHQQTFNLVPYAGQTIRIYFASTNNSVNPTYFFVDDVSVQVILGPPSNDNCNGAIGLPAGTTYTLNTATANSTGDPSPACQPTLGKGVWYTFTPLTSGTVTISTCGSDFNTALAVYTGSCGSLSQVACNDDNGPACTGSAASASFAGTAGTTYFILAGGVGGATGNLNILATVSGNFQIIPTFDSTITSDPQAATIEATINAAIAVYQASFTNAVTVAITFQEMGSGVGFSSSFYYTFNYSDYRAALVSHATTADDATALAHLPNTSGNPVNGNVSVNIRTPLARALGFSADPGAGQPDGTISLNTSAMNLGLAPTDPSKYSLFATASHEIDEVLAFTSALNGLANGAPSPTGPVAPEDLFRYDQSGLRSFTTSSNAASFFSLDGVTDLARFNQTQGGDYHDWYSVNGGQIPEVQDAYAAHGAAPVLGVELRVLDALGFARAISPLPTLSLARSSTNMVISWPATFVGFTLQSTTNLGPGGTWGTAAPSPVILNSRYTVTNVFAGSRNFYRLVK